VDTEANLTAQASPENAQAPTPEPAQPAPAPAQREQVGAITGGQPERAAPAPAPAPERDTTERTDLPRTASVLPLLALIGVGSLVGSRLLRRARQ
jgi:hypothetical protein